MLNSIHYHCITCGVNCTSKEYCPEHTPKPETEIILDTPSIIIGVFLGLILGLILRCMA